MLAYIEPTVAPEIVGIVEGRIRLRDGNWNMSAETMRALCLTPGPSEVLAASQVEEPTLSSSSTMSSSTGNTVGTQGTEGREEDETMKDDLGPVDVGANAVGPMVGSFGLSGPDCGSSESQSEAVVAGNTEAAGGGLGSSPDTALDPALGAIGGGGEGLTGEGLAHSSSPGDGDVTMAGPSSAKDVTGAPRTPEPSRKERATSGDGDESGNGGANPGATGTTESTGAGASTRSAPPVGNVEQAPEPDPMEGVQNGGGNGPDLDDAGSSGAGMTASGVVDVPLSGASSLGNAPNVAGLSVSEERGTSSGTSELVRTPVSSGVGKPMTSRSAGAGAAGGTRHVRSPFKLGPSVFFKRRVDGSGAGADEESSDDEVDELAVEEAATGALEEERSDEEEGDAARGSGSRKGRKGEQNGGTKASLGAWTGEPMPIADIFGHG